MTSIAHPAGLEQARKPIEELGRDIELHRMGLDFFTFIRWLAGPHKVAGDGGDAIEGVKASRCNGPWWNQQRRRRVSAGVSWAPGDASPLQPLLSLEKMDLKVP
jgi:hypothetical protein